MKSVDINKVFLRNCFALMMVVVAVISFGAVGRAAQGESEAKEKQSYNAPEKLIFGDEHMANVSYGQKLTYSFVRKGVFGDNFTDKVVMDIFKGKEADNKAVAFEFFTGKQRRPYPSFGYITTNPLITIYFNKDAWDLARKIKAKGTANYLRNRIIDGISNVTEIKDTTCPYEGRQLAAKQISFQPYIKDENNHQLAHFSAISYEVTIAAELPGGLCKIRSVVPQHVGGVPEHIVEKFKKSGMLQFAKEAERVNEFKDVKEPLLVEELTFESIGTSKHANAE